ncbi:MAG: hypothetical protein WCF18_05895 [Chthoniobacteraceae bacterium]
MTSHTANQIASAPADAEIAPGMARPSRREAGIALIQVIMAMGMIALCGAAGLRALIEINRKAAAMRTLSQARAIVQRNIDSALGVPFNQTFTPPILAVTAGTNTSENIVVGRSGAGAVVNGTLTRIVTQEANPPDNADMRRITFRLAYKYRLKDYLYEMTTIRAMD